MGWLYHLAYCAIGYTAGVAVANWTAKRRANRAAVQRRLNEWVG